MSFSRKAAPLMAALYVALAACGGDSSSRLVMGAAGSSPVVPDAVEYFDPDSGALTGRVLFDYGTPPSLSSSYLAPGEDGAWGTADDIESPYLGCVYQPDPDALPRQRFLPMQAVARSPSGAAIVAALGGPDGESMYCPALDDHWLVQESYCSGQACPGMSEGVGGYVMTISRSRVENVVTDTQVLVAYSEGVAFQDLGQSQETSITLDSFGRPVLVEIDVLDTDYASEALAETCDAGSNLALELLMYRSCKLLKESVRYTYGEGSVDREVDYYHGEVFSHTEHSTRTLDMNGGVYSVHIDKDFVSGEVMPTLTEYQFNERQQITGSATYEAGDDGVLGTGDDVVTPGPSYNYLANGNPASTWVVPGDTGIDYQYDARGRLLRETIYTDTSGYASAEYRYSYSSGRLASKEVYLPRSGEDPGLVIARRILFRSAVEGFPEGFSADRAQYLGATLGALERRFDLR